MESVMQQVLVTGLGETCQESLVRELEKRGHTVHVSPWGDAILDHVERIPYRGVVTGYPLPGAAFGILLSAIRSRASASRNAGLVVISDPDSVGDARRLIGRGVNRVVDGSQPVNRVVRELTALLAVAPRIVSKLPAKIALRMGDRPLSVLCQTENLSLTGMLVRGCTHCAPGARVAFRIELPDEDEPVEGIAEITRKADPLREGLQGFGARFLLFDGEGQDRFQSWLEARAGDVIHG